MKKRLPAIITFLLILLLAPSFKFNKKKPLHLYRPYLIQEMESTITELEFIIKNIEKPAQMQLHYHLARQHYKHIEPFVETYSPMEAKNFLNGPLVTKSEPEYGNKIFEPRGFQVIEETLFDGRLNIDTKELQVQVNNLIIELSKLKINYNQVELNDEVLLEMLQYQLYRIVSLNLNGYDATLTQTNVQETIWCLDGMEELMLAFKPYSKTTPLSKKLFQNFFSQLNQARLFLQNNKNYASFNRLGFIRLHIINLNKTIVQFHHSIKLPWTQNKKALYLNTEFLFGAESFNMGYFSIYYNDTINLELRQALGKKLFFDPILSQNNQRSCATCHNPQLAFTDGLKKSIDFSGGNELNRNAPTLLNVAFQQSFFYDGRAYQLEQQAIDVIHNPLELNGDLTKIAAKLQQNPTYQQLFAEAFKGTTETEITPYSVITCLAAYEKKLVSLNSRFDQYLRGNDKSMNEREINGYNLFAGKALCGSCHFFPVFNGTVPPFFNDTEFEVLGTPLNADNTTLDADLGRYEITKNHLHTYSFKTPTLRNIELTGPYMHNGVYATLDEVIDFYHKGGGVGLGFNVPNQTLPFDSLQLTPPEKQDLILFLKTLTDTTSYVSH